MNSPDALRIIAIVVGIVVGNGLGRLLWLRRRLLVSFWAVIVGLIVVGLITEQLFQLFGLGATWQAAFFPLLVGLGVGVAVTSARPPHRAAWWQLWKE